MKYGFVKIAAPYLPLTVADCKKNASAIAEIIKSYRKSDVKLLAFSELCITGATVGDLFLQKTLTDSAKETLLELTAATAGIDIVCVVGLPLKIGSRIFNCAAVIQNGALLGVVPKKHLSVSDKRIFSPAPEQNATVTIGGAEIPFGTNLLFFCREVEPFRFAVELGSDFYAPCPPSTLHSLAGANLIVNLSSEPETAGKKEARKLAIKSHSQRLGCAYLYANAPMGESTTDGVYAAHRLIAENGKLLAESELFSEKDLMSEPDLESAELSRTMFENGLSKTYHTVFFSQKILKTTLTRAFRKNPFIAENETALNERCEEILMMQSYALRKRMLHTNSKTLVLGISGGLDSCLALLAAVRTIDLLKKNRTDIIAVTMPCFGTTIRTRSNAQKLCEELGVTFCTVDITASVRQHFQDISHPEESHNVVYENAQARERTQVLMDIANQQNGLVIGTGDLSELALGWATYNGDHMSMYAVNASIPKTLIRSIVAYEASRFPKTALSETLTDILNTPVSPELLPAQDGTISQKTEELVGPYELHDFYLYYAIGRRFSPKKILYLAEHIFSTEYSKETLVFWLKNFYRRFFSQQFKRSCLPDGVKIGSVSLSPRGDWNMPSDAQAALWLSELED